MIKINTQALKKITNHALKAYPEECCGILCGERSAQGKIVNEVWETENNWNQEAIELFGIEGGTKKNRYSIAAKEMLKAQKKAREKNWVIIGIYHSHPDHSANPSENDRAIAFREYSYIIVSVEGKRKVTEIKSWTLDPDHQFQLEEISID